MITGRRPGGRSRRPRAPPRSPPRIAPTSPRWARTGRRCPSPRRVCRPPGTWSPPTAHGVLDHVDLACPVHSRPGVERSSTGATSSQRQRRSQAPPPASPTRPRPRAIFLATSNMALRPIPSRPPPLDAGEQQHLPSRPFFRHSGDRLHRHLQRQRRDQWIHGPPRSNSVAARSHPQYLRQGGYTFSGWNTARQRHRHGLRRRRGYPFSAAPPSTPSGARCKRTVTFNGNSWTVERWPTSQQRAHGPQPNTFARLATRFSGWNTLANGTGTAYADGALPLQRRRHPLRQVERGPLLGDLQRQRRDQWNHDPRKRPAPPPSPPIASPRAGYTFSGVEHAANGSGTAYADGATTPSAGASPSTPSGARCRPFTVTFNGNAGTSGTMTPKPQRAAALAPIASPGPATRFSGWNTAANGTGTAYADGAPTPSPPAPPSTPSGAPPWFTVTFNGNGATSGSMSQRDQQSPTALTPKASPALATLQRLETAANGTGTAYADGAIYPFTAAPPSTPSGAPADKLHRHLQRQRRAPVARWPHETNNRQPP